MLLWAVLALQAVLLLALVVLLLRRPPAPVADERLLRLPELLSALHARTDATDTALRQGVESLRRETAEAAAHGRRESDAAALALREEVARSIATLGRTLTDGLNSFRADNASSATELRTAVHAELKGIAATLETFFRNGTAAELEARNALHTTLADLSTRNTASHEGLRKSLHENLSHLAAKNTESHEGLRSALHGRLHDLSEQQHAHQERLRLSMEDRLQRINDSNTTKLEEMRVTVDEKLQTTLNERLTQSFGQVTTHLGDVQKGLGEMKELATGVSDLKKVFSNVKARGIVGEFQLGMQLEQMFSPDQYEKNVEVRTGSGERVEYALKVPQGSSHALFPIDSKFPREDWERLEAAYDHGGSEEIAKAGAAFERAIRAEGKRICEKYIAEPYTLPHAIMFLPTEGLYAEVMRRPGLQQTLQQACNVTIAGPSTLMAILTSFRMGFHTIAMERKGHEIEKVLGNVKSEFGKFGDMMSKVERQVGTVQNTLQDISGKTRTINRSLRGISELPASNGNGTALFEDLAQVAPLLAATADE